MHRITRSAQVQVVDVHQVHRRSWARASLRLLHIFFLQLSHHIISRQRPPVLTVPNDHIRRIYLCLPHLPILILRISKTSFQVDRLRIVTVE